MKHAVIASALLSTFEALYGALRHGCVNEGIFVGPKILNNTGSFSNLVAAIHYRHFLIRT